MQSISILAKALCLSLLVVCATAGAQQFKAGFGKRDVTPQKPVPMWGYSDRHADLSIGILDPLYAKAVVLDFGDEKIAIVGLDLGRSPGGASLQRIRDEVKAKSGVNYLMLVGSHTHHGPVMELKDEDGKGKGKFDDAVAYVREMEDGIIAAIGDAAKSVVDAKIGWGSTEVDMNRNRHTKWEPKPRDTELAVIRIDDADGKPIAVLVNFAAHPTSIPSSDLRFSADYPGKMMDTVEREMKTNCVFLQGAAGDMSRKGTATTNTFEAYGAAMGADVVRVAGSIATAKPDAPSLKVMDEDFSFNTRLDFTNPQLKIGLSLAFFPELANAFFDDLSDNKLEPHLTTTLINGQLALVGVSGEFFSQHSVRLKEHARDTKTLLLGYCNGHHMYFPTAEAVPEGGYGADEKVSWVEIGGPEKMIYKALVNIYEMLGKKVEK